MECAVPGTPKVIHHPPRRLLCPCQASGAPSLARSSKPWRPFFQHCCAASRAILYSTRIPIRTSNSSASRVSFIAAGLHSLCIAFKQSLRGSWATPHASASPAALSKQARLHRCCIDMSVQKTDTPETFFGPAE